MLSGCIKICCWRWNFKHLGLLLVPLDWLFGKTDAFRFPILALFEQSVPVFLQFAILCFELLAFAFVCCEPPHNVLKIVCTSQFCIIFI